MTIASATSRISYVGDGVTTAFAVPFLFQSNDDITVMLQSSTGVQTTQVLGTQYNLTGAGVTSGGTCTFTTAPTALTGAVITIFRDPPVTQTTSYNNNDPFPAKSHENALDKLTMLEQRTRDIGTRSLQLRDSDPVIDMHLPANRQNKLLGFDTNNSPIAVFGPTFVGSTATGVAIVDSRATAQITIFGASVNVVQTEGLVTPGDGGGANYVRGLVGDPGVFQDGGGVYWKTATFGVANVETRSTAALKKYPSTISVIETHGIVTPGDSPDATYIRGTGTGSFTDAAGISWKPASLSSNLRPDFGPVAAPWPNAIGDSLFTNILSTTPLPTLIATAMGWGSTNTIGVSGSTIADQASIYGFQMTPSIVNPAMVWLGTNDVILDSSDNRTTEQTSLEGLRALLCHLAIPTAKRVTGQAMTIEGGSWANMSGSLDPGGTTSTTQNSVKRGIVTGRHVVVAGWANLSSNGQMSVLIGNSDHSRNTLSDTITFKRAAILTNSPGGTPVQTVPFVRIYKNVGVDDTSKMEVSVFVTSATGAGNDAFVSYVAGLSGRQNEAMPLVLNFKLHNFAAATETAQGTNANRRERFNRGISNIIDEMMGLGLWVVPIDTASVLWDTTLLGDGLHPNASGKTALTTEAVTAIGAASNYWLVRNSELSNGGYSDTVGSDLYPKGRLVIEDFRRVVKARAAVGSGFSAHCNGSNTSVANNSNTIIPCITEIYDINTDYNAAAATWSPPAGQVSIRGAATFTAGVDQAAYELQLFKNSSLFKVLARTLASGTAPVAVMGDAYDLAADGDFYQLFVLQTSGGTATVDGTISKTYFMGKSAY